MRLCAAIEGKKGRGRRETHQMVEKARARLDVSFNVRGGNVSDDCWSKATSGGGPSTDTDLDSGAYSPLLMSQQY